jgi:hypothetical protein
MPRNGRKKHRVCKNCGTRFSGRYCPYCGAECGKPRALRSGGFVAGAFRLLLSLIVLALFLFVVFVALDFFASSGDGAHTTAQAVLSSVENALPKRFLDAYAMFKESYLAPVFAFLKSILN